LGGAVNGCPALLVEPIVSNLFQRSEEFENAYWTKSFGTVTQDQTTAPNGLTTADKYVVNNGQPSNSPIIRLVTFATNTTYTLSLFVKKADYDTASIRLNTTETGIVTNFFNLASGTATNNQIQNYGNGWYRVWVSFTTAATVTNGQVQLIRDAQVRDGVAGIFIWGAQLEVGSIATSYIPTTTAAVTRSADVISDSTASALIGQSEGTIYAEIDAKNFSSPSRIIAISDGTSNNRIIVIFNTFNRIRLLATVDTVSQVDINSSSQVSGVFKIAVAYALNDYAFYINGVQIGTDTTALVPACSLIALGNAETGAGSNINERIRAAAIYPNRLSNAQLEYLTSFASYEEMALALSYTLI
jgi:hypothetical protein